MPFAAKKRATDPDGLYVAWDHGPGWDTPPG